MPQIKKDYGVRFRSTKDKNKWIWHRGKKGVINRFTKEGAEARASMWEDDLVKVMKITARSK